MTTVSQQILRRIRGKGRGWVFTPADFAGLGSRDSIDQTLSRLVARNSVRRLDRGLYDYPKQSPRLGLLSPKPDDIASALARQSGAKLQVSGARAANALGLTTQSPAKTVYLTDGPARKAQFGRQVIELRHVNAKRLAGAGNVSGAVLQALRYLGRDAIDDNVVNRLRRVLSDDDKKALRRDGVHAPAWVHPIIDDVALAA